MAAAESDSDRTKSSLALAAGTEVLHYRIISKIGAGGMGEVYLAEDTELDRQVALKFLPPHFCQDDDCRARFKREAQSAARLNHPNIVTIHEVNEHQGRPFFAMEYVAGQSLKDVIKTKELSLARIVELAMLVSDGLSKAHQAGIIHRDIKPSNVVIDADDRPKLLDFGLATVQGGEQLTKTGSTLGTVGYMSPEQVQGEQTDARSDLFSLGVVLYELIAGRPPVKGDSEAATLHAITSGAPQPLARYRSDVPAGLQSIIDKALDKDIQTRYQSAAGVTADLKKLARTLQAPVGGLREDQPSIAVLPFTNMSTEPDQEYFCDGMAEEIINALTRLENLRVIARTSAFAFKGKQEDVREIGRKLDVENLLEGSVRKAGNRLRITAQLVRAADGSHLWSDRYDREMEDVFAIQDEISEAIVSKLKIRLAPSEETDPGKRHTDNIEVYNLYLKGRFHWSKRTPKEIEQAIEYFKQAIQKAPGYALAYSGLADCYSVLQNLNKLPAEVAYGQAEAMASKAIELDGSLSEAHASMGLIRMFWKWDMRGAIGEFERAIELNPSYASAHHWYAFTLGAMGRMSEAIERIRIAQELDPISPAVHAAAGLIYLVASEYDLAEEQCRLVLEMDQSYMMIAKVMAAVYEHRGMYDEAIEERLRLEVVHSRLAPEEIEALRRVYRQSGWSGFFLKDIEFLKQRAGPGLHMFFSLALDYAELGKADDVIYWLEKAYEDRDPNLVYIRLLGTLPVWHTLQQDPRFTALLAKMGLE